MSTLLPSIASQFDLVVAIRMLGHRLASLEAQCRLALALLIQPSHFTWRIVLLVYGFRKARCSLSGCAFLRLSNAGLCL